MGQKPRFTPGPWIWAPNFHGLYGSGKDNAVLNYAAYEGMWVADYLPTGKANAQLISAAPDMYKALEAAIEQVREELNYLIEQGPPKEWNCDVYRLSLIVNAGDAALAKARGEQ
jgi:hypothetical protein